MSEQAFTNKKHGKPIFSVVIPLFNKARWIERCVHSVLSQNYPNFEVIVVDDGSTDDGGELLGAIDDARLRVIVKQNEGVGRARNSGVDAATGGWVAFLDADDMWCQGHLSELARIIDFYSEVSMVSTAVNPASEGSLCCLDLDPEQGEIEKVDYFRAASKRTSIVNSSAVAIRSDVFRKLGGFTYHQMGEDLRFWALVALNGYEVAVSNRKDVLYFQDTKGVTKINSRNRKNSKSARDIHSFKDLSPSLALIKEYADLSDDLLKNPSICLYINSRVMAALENSIVSGRQRKQIDISRCFVGSLNRKQALFCWLARLRLGFFLKILLLARRYFD